MMFFNDTLFLLVFVVLYNRRSIFYFSKLYYRVLESVFRWTVWLHRGPSICSLRLFVFFFFWTGIQFYCSGLSSWLLSKSVWQNFHGESKLMTLNMPLGPIILSVIQCVSHFDSIRIWRAISQFDLAIVFSLHDILTHYLHALLNICYVAASNICSILVRCCLSVCCSLEYLHCTTTSCRTK